MTGEKPPLEGPLVYALISSAETAFKQASLNRPGMSPQPTALAKSLKEVNAAAEVGEVSGKAPEKMIAALKGGLTGCRMTIPETDSAPADWPYMDGQCSSSIAQHNESYIP